MRRVRLLSWKNWLLFASVITGGSPSEVDFFFRLPASLLCAVMLGSLISGDLLLLVASAKLTGATARTNVMRLSRGLFCFESSVFELFVWEASSKSIAGTRFCLARRNFSCFRDQVLKLLLRSRCIVFMVVLRSVSLLLLILTARRSELLTFSSGSLSSLFMFSRFYLNSHISLFIQNNMLKSHCLTLLHRNHFIN